MTGALVAVGQGRLSVAQLKEVLEARNSLAYPQGLAAPAHGLFLTRVDYTQTGTFHLMKVRAGANTFSHAENLFFFFPQTCSFHHRQQISKALTQTNFTPFCAFYKL